MSLIKITLTASGWTQTLTEIYWDTVEQVLYADKNCTTEVLNLDPPTRECWKFNGFFENSSADLGDKYVDEDGTFTDAFFDKLNTLSSNITIYINSTQKSWKVSISPNYGIEGSGTSAIYQAIDSRQFFATDLCEGEPISRVNIYKREGYIFNGCWENQWTQGRNFISYDGDLLEPLTSLVLSSSLTVWASWISPVIISISSNSGAGGLSSFYFDKYHNVWYADNKLTQRVARITTHTRECYKLLGYMATNEDTGVLRVSADGTIDTSWIPTNNETIYARWLLVSYKVTIGKQSGTGGTDAIYYKSATSPKEWYADDLCTQQITSLPELPSRDGYSLKGIYSTTSSTVKYIDRNGSFTADLEALAITAAKTIYAQWNAVYKMTLNDGSGAGGDGAIYYDSLDGVYFADQSLVRQVTSVALPVQECFAFTGYWSVATGGTQYTNADGSFTAALQSLAPTTAKTFYAQWTRTSYKITLNDEGGTGGRGTAYVNGSTVGFFADDRCTQPITTVHCPAKSGYTFIGYYATASGGSKYIDETGRIIVAVALSAAVTIHARYTANQYTLTFDYQGGSGSPASKTVTFGQAVGVLPTPTKANCRFIGWYVNDEKITSTTVWNVPNNATAMVVWRAQISPNCGQVDDWFNLENDALVAIASSSGEDKPHLTVAHYGKIESGVDQSAAQPWRNPEVTYQVVRNCTFATILGKAFTRTGGSGYFITKVEISTAIGQFPTVKVSGTANEGADAINKFNVSVPLLARTRAQNLLNAVSGGGQIQSCKIVASCNPVVIKENLMPCASDIVEGKMTVTAALYAPDGQNAPTASNGFVLRGTPKECGDKNYLMWNLTAEKGM